MGRTIDPEFEVITVQDPCGCAWIIQDGEQIIVCSDAHTDKSIPRWIKEQYDRAIAKETSDRR